MYHISMHLAAGLLLEHFGTMTLCTVWLGNRVEAMEFPGALQTKEDITNGCISDSDLVASSTDKFSVGTDLTISRTYATDFHQLYNSDVILVCNPPGNSMASTLFPNYTVQRHIEPKCSNKSPAAKCAEIR